MTCRILTSFAMVNHGSTFVHWLRNELMKSLNLYEIDAVYVDSVVSRSVGYEKDATPDRRDHMRSPTGAFPLGAMRDDWEALYRSAMRSAQVMLFCYTDDFMDSPWCCQEWALFLLEMKRRPMSRPLRGIVLNFTAMPCRLFGSGEPGITHLSVAKTDGRMHGMAWDRGDYILSPVDYRRLLVAIGPSRR